MKSIKKTSILTFAFAFLALQAIALSEAWELAKEKNAIKVYTRTSSSSTLKDSKAMVSLPVNPSKVIEFLNDFDNYPTWMHKCSKAKLLKKASDMEYYVYMVIDSPWPVSDRDLISHVTATEKSDGTIILDMKSAPDFIPKKDGIVRITDFEGFWKIMPTKQHNVDLIYQFHTDPAGNIPNWMANSTAVDIPFFTLENMKKQVR
ncbi:MAG: START domain-containing protein [Chitinophagales bacterium]